MTTTPGDVLKAIRAQSPLVQCITNYVAMNVSANVLLATGASPAMVHASEESGDFTAVVGALTINIGTLSPSWVEGMTTAINAAHTHSKPWVFDPVAHFATPYRSGVARDILSLEPTVIRGNASEILALSGRSGSGKGVDAGDAVAAAKDGARELAVRYKSIVAVTGEQDFVTDGTRAAHIEGGSPFMPQVTALGCALTCLTGAGIAAVEDPFDATVGVLAIYGAAGREAGKTADGPGSFAWKFLDALNALAPEDVSAELVGYR
ncbi:hydroxyethylthiazole kinase [Qingshengfaniella alkalisoli]|nr:hydroxyethylthiazole kinase [Qingshengfaniella alkalisoli]